jgi:hypothetical protein
MAGQFAQQQERRMAQPAFFAGLEGKRRHLLRGAERHQVFHAFRDADAAFVKTVFPEQASHERTFQLRFRREDRRRSSFVGTRLFCENVETHSVYSL